MTITGTEVPLVVVSIAVITVLATFAWPALVASATAEAGQVAGEAADLAAAEARRIEAEAAELAAAEAAEAESRRIERGGRGGETGRAGGGHGGPAPPRRWRGRRRRPACAQIFQQRHDLGPVVQHVGNEPAVRRARSSTPSTGRPRTTASSSGSCSSVTTTVTVRGAVDDGIVRISTAFVARST